MNRTKRCRYGEMMYRTNDLFIGRSFDVYGEFSEGEVAFFRQLVGPGQTVLDVGANIGAHTVPLAQMVGPQGRVLAFEPQRAVYYLLCGNVAQNNLEAVVHCHLAAVGAERGAIAVPELTPDVEQNFGGLSLAGNAWQDADQVPVMRIDDLPLSACDLIKVDVEGMECDVLAGATETIRRFRPLLYIEDDRQDRSAELRRVVASLGYELYFHAPFLFNPENFADNALNIFVNIASHNLFAHPAEKASPVVPASCGLQPIVVARSPERPPVGVAALGEGPAEGNIPQAAVDQLNRGLALYGQGEFAAALATFQQCLAEKPDFAEAYNNAGLAAAALGKADEALAAYRRAIALKPSLAEAHHNLALGLRQSRQLDAALASCQEAVRLSPEFAEAHNTLGNLLQELGRLEESLEVLQAAVRLKPDLAAAHNNLGIGCWQLGRLEEAAGHYRRALEVAPDMAEAENNLATVWRDMGQINAAMKSYDRALALRPEYGDARWNRSLLSLLQGDFERGWNEYEYRWLLPSFQRRNYPQPLWDGGSLEGKTILLTAEQGLGDTIQFLRYAALVRQRGARVLAEVHRPLRRLAKTCAGVDQVVVLGESPPSFDTHAPWMSLPRLFETTADSIPADVPYLTADPALVDEWRGELAALEGFKIGIAWRGSPQNGMDRSRSIPLAMFEALSAVPGVTLISLQKGVGADQIAEVAARFKVVDFGSRLDELSGPFMDTAALMKSLDLIVVCDSALAHLAGALGAPVWVALMRTPDWRWLLDRDDCPWYPTARLFRQTQPGDWPELFGRMAEQLSTFVERRAAAPLDVR